ncbi:MAG: LrgB family protein [Treponema sp.]|jgi:predicted murein hydrolase (TIGR00659 family)|nr:LrgB family protein [Treponema sp.]
MPELYNEPVFGIALSLAAFWIGGEIQKRTRLIICNPLLIAIALVIAVLLVFRIPYDYYYAGGAVIDVFLVPATVCIALSIHTKIDILKKNWLPILAGCIAGSLASMLCVYGLCRLFNLDEEILRSMLPKSVTTPIALGISEGNSGIASITVLSVLFSGITGNVLAPALIKCLRIKDPIAAGLSIGACSHAIGTSKALEIGETEGAMSGLAIGVCGIITVILSLFIYKMI